MKKAKGIIYRHQKKRKMDRKKRVKANRSRSTGAYDRAVSVGGVTLSPYMTAEDKAIYESCFPGCTTRR